MSTQNQTMDKIADMLKSHNEQVLRVAKAKLNSGCLDLGSYNPDEYLLAKLILTSSLRDCANSFEPPFDGNKEELDNLSRF